MVDGIHPLLIQSGFEINSNININNNNQHLVKQAYNEVHTNEIIILVIFITMAMSTITMQTTTQHSHTTASINHDKKPALFYNDLQSIIRCFIFCIYYYLAEVSIIL